MLLNNSDKESLFSNVHQFVNVTSHQYYTVSQKNVRPLCHLL